MTTTTMAIDTPIPPAPVPQIRPPRCAGDAVRAELERTGARVADNTAAIAAVEHRLTALESRIARWTAGAICAAELLRYAVESGIVAQILSGGGA